MVMTMLIIILIIIIILMVTMIAATATAVFVGVATIYVPLFFRTIIQIIFLFRIFRYHIGNISLIACVSDVTTL